MPNLAIATELRTHWGADSGVEFFYIGSRRLLDRELVQAADIPFKSIFAGKVRRYWSWRHLVDPFLVLIGFFQSLGILIRFRPHAVFTKGGFVSVPVALAAFVLRRPIVLHESDSRMGIANRLISRLAKQVCVSFPGVLDKSPKRVFTGNPIRMAIGDGDPAKGYQLTGLRSGKPIVLVWGGSQGAQEVNDLVVSEFDMLKDHFQIIHITGRGKQTPLQNLNYVQYEYLGSELKHIYAITDFVVGRAGANSLYELAFVGKPNILIPLKNADQIGNADYFEQKGASIILRGRSLYDVLTALRHSPEKQESMKRALAVIAKPEAAEHIAGILLNI